jgi:hypothetical protein
MTCLRSDVAGIIRMTFCTDPDPRIRTSDLMDPDPSPDHAIFVSDFQERNKKLLFLLSFVDYYFLKVNIHHI